MIDEQHRFGVRQRATLRQKSALIDLLVMTATPIPRTLALALYGDLDVSTIDEMPPGRVPIQTALAPEAEAFDACAGGRGRPPGLHRLSDHRGVEPAGPAVGQGRVRAPARDGLGGPESRAHPRRHAGQAKTKVMDEFVARRMAGAVATPVIEVGIDVPNATVMVIQNADRFGLAPRISCAAASAAAPAVHLLSVAEPKTPQARTRLDTWWPPATASASARRT